MTRSLPENTDHTVDVERRTRAEQPATLFLRVERPPRAVGVGLGLAEVEARLGGGDPGHSLGDVAQAFAAALETSGICSVILKKNFHLIRH